MSLFFGDVLASVGVEGARHANTALGASAGGTISESLMMVARHAKAEAGRWLMDNVVLKPHVLVAVVIGLVLLVLLGIFAYVRRDDASLLEMLHAGPRTMRVVWWGTWAAYNYKKLAAAYTADVLSEELYKSKLSKFHRRAAHSLLRVCQRNGGIYVKAGQTAASMQNLPSEYREELEGLEDSVPPRPFSSIRKTLKKDLGHKMEDVFEEFDVKATAAASLAQVHKARLKDGTEVAVKVQYPGLESALNADLFAMSTLAAVAAVLFPASDWRWMFTELREKLSEELDFRNEADNAARLAACFAGRDDITVPRLFPRLSSSKVLCMEWIHGIKVSDVQGLKKAGLSPRQVALVFQEAAAEMMCVHGYVHGDMHPGNIFVRPLPPPSNPLAQLLPWCRRSRPQLVLIDHGLYFHLPSDMRLLYCMMWCAFVLKDSATASAAAIQLAGETAGRALPEMLKPRDWNAMAPEERMRVRKRVGMGAITDVRKVMNETPQELVDCLRAMTIVRHTCARLGANVADRLRVNAVEALRGLKVQQHDITGRASRPRVEYIGVMRSRWKRWRLWVHIATMKLVAWVVLVFGDAVPDDETESQDGEDALVSSAASHNNNAGASSSSSSVRSPSGTITVHASPG